VLAVKLDEQMTLALPETDGSVAEESFAAIAEFAQKTAVFCMGPGLTTHPETMALVHRLLAELRQPVVLDADGLNALAMKPDIARERYEKGLGLLILTPHPGEAARLLGTSIAEVQSNRVAAVREIARRYDAVAL